jgi:hypothetical protein
MSVDEHSRGMGVLAHGVGEKARTIFTARDGRATAGTARPSRLWLWFVAAFLLQAAAWTAWFIVASQHRVAEVPLTYRAR